MNFFSTKTRERTSQFNRVNIIKDERLRISKAKKIANEYSLDLDKYSEDFENLLPEFREAISNSIQAYTEIILKSISSDIFDEDSKNELLENIPSFLSSVEVSIDGTADFLETFTQMKISLTTKFSTSKRRAELATNNIFKELIRTRNLLRNLLEE